MWLLLVHIYWKYRNQTHNLLFYRNRPLHPSGMERKHWDWCGKSTWQQWQSLCRLQLQSGGKLQRSLWWEHLQGFLITLNENNISWCLDSLVILIMRYNNHITWPNSTLFMTTTNYMMKMSFCLIMILYWYLIYYFPQTIYICVSQHFRSCITHTLIYLWSGNALHIL